MKPEDQMTFNFRASEKNDFPEIDIKPMEIKRAVLAWLIPENPSGIGVKVPTRFSRYQADIAAFWSHPGSGRHLVPGKTLIVEMRHQREDCWPDCSKHEELLPLLRQKKAEKRSLEEIIREEEPELKDSDNLFNEYESWRYEESKNKNYHRCLRQIEDSEHAIYKGSRFEQIRCAHVADFLYLAVPAGTVHPHELADGWGLLYVYPDMKVEVILEADDWGCNAENKLHLIQNIAASCKKSLLFSYGIRENSEGEAVFTPVPRRRRGKRMNAEVD